MNLKASKIDLHASWLAQLEPEFNQPYMRELKAFLLNEKQAGKVIYPASKNIFNAFNSAPLDQVKVVILGQDPYHGPGQAHGLCFSVQPGVQVPPSLQNIYKELKRDLGCEIPRHGYLQSWAEQGVLLLNATLTVEHGRAGSHQKQGWETFTDRAIQTLSQEREGVVFMLWGSYAQKKAALLDPARHLILKSSHPSPLSAYRGFLGCGHFSKANEYLRQRGQEPINWCLPDIPG
ncbi:uracil-DNA glycosylase [Marinimicrobium sp. ABcell2]|uniref:uracil-DNA glycosylase n=1 Tax=Marinimicrobium sp. ABcell2 TaxID=3069751 RepID=UPI0027B002E7|nr:uracil-DNA glycosylase [Marinimicrobium sp. ABcell2]MDQ2077912.1 uracil-DNA glycosylase [Marinimicrobium sp. ABcell2]